MLARPLLIDSAKRSAGVKCPAQPAWHGAQAEKEGQSRLGEKLDPTNGSAQALTLSKSSRGEYWA